jgi:hypothetical protein
MRRAAVAVLGVILAIGLPTPQEHAAAQSSTPNADSGSFHLGAGTIIFAELSKTLDARKAKAGDSVEAKTTARLLSHGQVVVPDDTRIIGSVTEAKASSKDERDSKVGISFGTLFLSEGRRLSFQCAIQAIGRPIPGNYGIPMPGGGGGTVTSPNAPSGTAVTRLNALSEGAIGLPELTLKSSLQGGVINSQHNNVHLESGTQFILRVTN